MSSKSYRIVRRTARFIADLVDLNPESKFLRTDRFRDVPSFEDAFRCLSGNWLGCRVFYGATSSLDLMPRPLDPIPHLFHAIAVFRNWETARSTRCKCFAWYIRSLNSIAHLPQVPLRWGA